MTRYRTFLSVLATFLWVAMVWAETPTNGPRTKKNAGRRPPVTATAPKAVPPKVPLVTPDSLLRQADRMVSWKAYGRAIDIYTQLLADTEGPLNAPQRTAATVGLANAYRLVGDNTKAEKYYRDWLARVPATERRPQPVLQLAQTLAANGKFKEAEGFYEEYNQLLDAQKARRAAEVTTEAGQRSRSSQPVQYRLESLELNTKNEEFSPMYYRNGLVYVAGSKGGSAIETAGSGGGSGYLDLLYIPNRNDILASTIIGPDGSEVKADNPRNRRRNRVGEDAYTRPTSNDSKTVPSFSGGIRASEGLGYDARPVSAAQQFSKSLNTRYHEGPATFYADGSRIIFTRNNYNDGKARKSAEGVNKLKLYTAEQQNGAWVNVEEMPFNSDEYSVGHPTLTRDGRTLYFASDMPGGQGGSDIYVTQYQNGRWSKPVNLGTTVNSKGNELFPFVDEAGNLYFASDGKRGLGGLDIFMATMAGTAPQTVEHLDAPINSPQDDFGLITDANRQSGYFSTNRRNGSDDIMRFVRQSSLYACRDLTIRLYDADTDQPLDSVQVDVVGRTEGGEDQQLITDKNGLVRLCLQGDSEFRFVSSRDGYVSSTVGFSTQGLTDDQPSRLEIGLSKPTLMIDTVYTAVPGSAADMANLTRSRIRGIVATERDQRPIEGVTVTLRNECDKSVQSVVTGPDGVYVFDLTEGCDYTLVTRKPTYGTSTKKIKKLPKKSKPKQVEADVRMFSVGDVVTLDNIYYDLDKSTIRSDAARELDKLVSTMRRYPSLVIEVRSHTDSKGDAGYNRELSTRRARSVADYLVSKGISRKRITARGYGESMLLNNCTDGVICTDDEHQRNRRTEFKVLAIK
ncbi:OmpA family protein [Rudanella paleaurantiibacter]|uniref:OmpA family protein n=1 Tax=Rudanella paleaurantiibacter TaxID=2614655 RepID=A0A7J5U2R5_9BACT|nr:OmpA family protein [Rudanella paleaurantiibacter]KAB7732087.1 OmpA family protein [Rudanella paleaurantiibacter]